MKKSKIIIGSCLLTIGSLLLTGCGKEIEVKNGSKVAVSIDDIKYTATEYYKMIKEDNIQKLVETIDKELLTKKYKSNKDEKDAIAKQINQIKSIYGEDATFISVIEQYFGVSSEQELEEKLSLEYKRNLAAEDYIKNHLASSEIKKYYNENIYGEVSASHILIAPDVVSDASDAEKEEANKVALEKAKQIIKEYQEGKSFQELAETYSTDKASASKGGDLGYFDLNSMVTEFSDALKQLKVDEYTKEPVKSQFGYHIILKTGEKEKPALKDVKKEIKETLAKNKLNNDAALYYETLKNFREENKIKWNDSSLKKAYDKYMDKLIDNAKSTN